MQAYVLGFLFSDRGSVLLMTKERPDFMRGRLNGIGGKIEPNELPHAAMVREASEEVHCPGELEWLSCGQFWAEARYTVHVYCARYRGDTCLVYGKTDEFVEWYRSHSLPDNILDNVAWLVPICRANAMQGLRSYFVVQEEVPSEDLYKAHLDSEAAMRAAFANQPKSPLPPVS